MSKPTVITPGGNSTKTTWYSRNKERQQARMAAYYLANKDKITASNAEWAALNPGRRKQISDAHYRQNKDRLLVMRRARYADNPSATKEQSRKWRLLNPEKVKAQAHRRRTKLHEATVGNTAVIARWERRYSLSDSVRCYWCNGTFPGKHCHTDHVISLDLDGPHEIGNLCISCGPCNLSKNHASLAEWNKRLREPVLF